MASLVVGATSCCGWGTDDGDPLSQLGTSVQTLDSLTFRDWVYPRLEDVHRAYPHLRIFDPYCWESDRYHGLLLDRSPGGAAGGAPTPDTSLVVLLSREAESKVDAIKRSYLRKLTGNIRVKADYLGLLPFPIWVGGEQRAVSLSAFRSIKLDVAV